MDFLDRLLAYFRSFSGTDLVDFASVPILVTSIATVVSFLTLFFQSTLWANRPKTTQKDVHEALQRLVAGDYSIDFKSIDFVDITRLDELRSLQLRYQRQASRSAFAFNLLVFVQYVVGAVLATSFFALPNGNAAQGSFTVGGMMGLIVLVATAVQQRYRPDILATHAKNRLTRCGRLIREVEDGILDIQAKKPGAPSILDLRSFATRGIDDLEAIELSGMESYYVQRLEIAAQNARPVRTAQEGVGQVEQAGPEDQSQEATERGR